MGIVKKQGINNSIWNYAGLVLGYVNMGLIMAKILSTENLGLRSVMFQAGSFFSVIALVGLANVVNRFFPSLKGKPGHHGGILSFIFVYSLSGIVLSSFLLYLFREPILDYYADRSSVLEDFFGFLVPFGASLALFEGLAAYSRALLKTTFPIFIRELAIRVYNLVLLALLYFKVFDFDQFLYLYLSGYIFGVMALIIYLFKEGEFKIVWKHAFDWVSKIREMLRFGMYTWFNNSTRMIVKTADVLMLGSYDLKYAGIYGIGSLIGNIVQVPSQSLRQIAAPLISRHFEEDNIAEIGNLYRKTCMIQLISGLFIYLGIILNLDTLFTIWRPEFAPAKMVIVLLGSARLVAGSTGLNGRIIVESKYFRMNFIFNLLMGIMVIATNAWLIPKYQIFGAATASALTITVISALKVLFVYSKFGLQPFDYKTLITLGLGAVAFFAAYFIPATDIFIVDIAVKSIVFSAIYIPLMVRFKLSDGINEMVFGALGKAKKVIGK